MTGKEIKTKEDLLRFLVSIRGETEHVEFKEWSRTIPLFGTQGSDKRNLYGYCVGIGNVGGGFLVIGVTDKGEIVGTTAQFPKDIKGMIYSKTGQRIEISEINTGKGRVLVVEIPSRKNGELLRYNGAPLMRIGDRLIVMDEKTIKDYLDKDYGYDRSKNICENATIDDLSREAIKIARKRYVEKFPSKKEEVEIWDDITFLNKIKITINGKITNTAILLLGNPESMNYTTPSIGVITWILKNSEGESVDYEHFEVPFILAVDKVFDKIRHLKFRFMTGESIFPDEIDKYDPYIIRESLNNCIAHQDYTRGGRIVVVENEDSLVFENLGSFIPRTIENVIETNAPADYYRNPFLANAMVNLNLIDTMGSGIRKMFSIQRNRLFPMPEYDLSDDKVKVTIYGKIIDMNYTRKLAEVKNLSLEEIILLDKVQKHNLLNKDEANILRKKNLIEGRVPNVYISSKLANKTNQKKEYINDKGLNDSYYSQLIIEYLENFGESSRSELDDLLLPKLGNILSNQQKKKKVENLLQSMKKEGKIHYILGKKWALLKSKK